MSVVSGRIGIPGMNGAFLVFFFMSFLHGFMVFGAYHSVFAFDMRYE